jgi:hypothetical protein
MPPVASSRVIQFNMRHWFIGGGVILSLPILPFEWLLDLFQSVNSRPKGWEIRRKRLIHCDYRLFFLN